MFLARLVESRLRVEPQRDWGSNPYDGLSLHGYSVRAGARSLAAASLEHKDDGRRISRAI